MKRLSSLILGLTLALNSGLASAAFKDGNRLLAEMTSKQGADWFIAMGYVTGVMDAGNGTVSCAPGNVTAGQVFDLVQQYLQANPIHRHFQADVVVNYVTAKAWPCPKTGNNM